MNNPNRIMHDGEQNGKRIPHRSAAFYALQHLKSGRTSVGHSSPDVHGTSTQLNGRSRLESMEEVVAVNGECGGEIYYLHDVLSHNDADDPSVVVARKLDWQEFVPDLPAREKAVVEFLIEGAASSTIARKLRTTDSKIGVIKQHLAKAIVEFMGPEILKEIQRRPRSKDGVMATREKWPVDTSGVAIEPWNITPAPVLFSCGCQRPWEEGWLWGSKKL
jgi:hypothetical protein